MEAQDKKKTREGIVISTEMQKTTVVRVSRLLPHPRYKKVVISSKKYYAHCEKEGVEVGKRVRIRETRPLSKLKRWIVVDVLS
jgi:small subunit ribosomal protein S17